MKFVSGSHLTLKMDFLCTATPLGMVPLPTAFSSNQPFVHLLYSQISYILLWLLVLDILYLTLIWMLLLTQPSVSTGIENVPSASLLIKHQQ